MYKVGFKVLSLKINSLVGICTKYYLGDDNPNVFIDESYVVHQILESCS